MKSSISNSLKAQNALTVKTRKRNKCHDDAMSSTLHSNIQLNNKINNAHTLNAQVQVHQETCLNSQ